MEPDFPRLKDCTIAVIGLGLMGGSLVMALRGKCKAIFAADPDFATRQIASQFRVVDRIAGQARDIVPDADVVVLSAPIGVILETIPNLPRWTAGSPVVLDFGSTKTEITKALAWLPRRFHPIGGHPMCGKEISGLGAADPELFRGAPFALTPLAEVAPDRGWTTPQARVLAAELVQTLGARPLWLEADTHDEWVAHTSHLPYLLSAALALVTPEDAAPLIGPGFRSVSRLAGSHPVMMDDILRTNRENILRALEALQHVLGRIEADLKADLSEHPRSLLREVKQRREMLLLRSTQGPK